MNQRRAAEPQVIALGGPVDAEELPLYLNERTFAVADGMSQTGQEQTYGS